MGVGTKEGISRVFRTYSHGFDSSRRVPGRERFTCRTRLFSLTVQHHLPGGQSSITSSTSELECLMTNVSFD